MREWDILERMYDEGKNSWYKSIAASYMYSCGTVNNDFDS